MHFIWRKAYNVGYFYGLVESLLTDMEFHALNLKMCDINLLVLYICSAVMFMLLDSYSVASWITGY